jgi:hypothetical protein
VKIDAAAESNGLARAAMQAVARIATFAGHPTKAPPEAAAGGGANGGPAGGGGKGGGGTSAAVIVIPLAALLLAAGIAGWVVRRNRASDARPPGAD